MAAAGDNFQAKRNEQGEEFLNWAKGHKHVKMFTQEVPDGVLPSGYQGLLHDLQVKVKFGPDDAMYDMNPDLRQRLARGNTVLELTEPSSRLQTYLVVYALKKFTGGAGDDDDRDDRNDKEVWKRYFNKPVSDAAKIVATKKANGEALHVASIKIANVDYWVAGSKNTHLLFADYKDIALYTHDRYRVAKSFCTAFLAYLETLPAESGVNLTAHLQEHNLTAVFEILCSDHQHVEDLSHLTAPLPVFIAWTSNNTELESFTSQSPERGLEIAKSFCLQTVEYDVFPISKYASRMTEILHGYGYEGYVLYFVDADDQVFGLLKKKTAWYILVRAIREKSKHVVTLCRKDPNRLNMSECVKKMHKRIDEIKSWLELPDSVTESWKILGSDCLKFCVKRMSCQQGTAFQDDVYSNFPRIWKLYLESQKLDDHVFTPTENL